MGCHTWYTIPDNEVEIHDAYMRQCDVVELDKIYEEKANILLAEFDNGYGSGYDNPICIWDICPGDFFEDANVAILYDKLIALKKEIYKDVQLYETIDVFWDGFRIDWELSNSEPEPELYNFDEAFAFINKHESVIHFDVSKEHAIQYVKLFFTQYPDGYIHFG